MYGKICDIYDKDKTNISILDIIEIKKYDVKKIKVIFCNNLILFVKNNIKYYNNFIKKYKPNNFKY